MDIDLYLKLGALQGEMSRTRETLFKILDEVAEGHEVDAMRADMKRALMDLWDAHSEVKGKLVVEKTYIKSVFGTAPKSREEHTRLRTAMRIVPELIEANAALRLIEESVGAQMLAFATAPPLFQAKLLPLAPQSHLTLYSPAVQEKIGTCIELFANRAHGVIKLISIYAGKYLCGIRMHIPRVFYAVLMFEQFTCGEGYPVIGPVTVVGEDYYNKTYPATPTNVPVFKEITLCAERARDFFTLATPESAVKLFLVWLSKYDDLMLRPCKCCKKLFDKSAAGELRMPPTMRHPLTHEAFHRLCIPSGTFDGTLPPLDPKVFEEPLFLSEEEELEEAMRKRVTVKEEEKEEEGEQQQQDINKEEKPQTDGLNPRSDDTTAPVSELAQKKIKLGN